MNSLPPEQLKARIEAAIATLRRLIDFVYLGEEAHVQISRTIWRLTFELERITTDERTRTPRA